MYDMIPLQAFADKHLLPLLLTTLTTLPRAQLLHLLLPIVAWLLEENQAHDDTTFQHFEHELHTILTRLGRYTTERRLLREASLQPCHIEVDGILHRAVTDRSVLVHHPYGCLRVLQRRYRPVGVRATQGTTVPLIASVNT